jgi:plastocyanin
MKKAFVMLFASLAAVLPAFAETYVITVANYQFTPKTVNANVGDIIRWEWADGSHTTTSTSVPNGANDWNSNINSGKQSYEYVLNVAGTYTYECVPHAPDMSGTIQVSGALPVKFGDLIINASRSNKAVLTWQAFNEENIAQYVIKRSSDLTHYTEVGRVAAKGSSSAAVHYSFTDESLSGADRYLYYYLEATDKDGRKSLSAIRLYRNESGASKIIKSISPNPAPSMGHITVQFNAEKTSTAFAKVIESATGQVIMQTGLYAVAGLNNGHLPIGHHQHLPAGNYNLVLTVDGRTETSNFVILP